MKILNTELTQKQNGKTHRLQTLPIWQLKMCHANYNKSILERRKCKHAPIIRFERRWI